MCLETADVMLDAGAEVDAPEDGHDDTDEFELVESATDDADGPGSTGDEPGEGPADDHDPDALEVDAEATEVPAVDSEDTAPAAIPAGWGARMPLPLPHCHAVGVRRSDRQRLLLPLRPGSAGARCRADLPYVLGAGSFAKAGWSGLPPVRISA